MLLGIVALVRVDWPKRLARWGAGRPSSAAIAAAEDREA
jgi:hypothetical protein